MLKTHFLQPLPTFPGIRANINVFLRLHRTVFLCTQLVESKEAHQNKVIFYLKVNTKFRIFIFGINLNLFRSTVQVIIKTLNKFKNKKKQFIIIQTVRPFISKASINRQHNINQQMPFAGKRPHNFNLYVLVFVRLKL